MTKRCDIAVDVLDLKGNSLLVSTVLQLKEGVGVNLGIRHPDLILQRIFLVERDQIFVDSFAQGHQRVISNGVIRRPRVLHLQIEHKVLDMLRVLFQLPDTESAVLAVEEVTRDHILQHGAGLVVVTVLDCLIRHTAQQSHFPQRRDYVLVWVVRNHCSLELGFVLFL